MNASQIEYYVFYLHHVKRRLSLLITFASICEERHISHTCHIFRMPVLNNDASHMPCRMVNACATLLRDHGAAYAQWAEGSGSRDGPLQVARAILLMPPPFEVPLSHLCSLLAPLLETGLVGVGRVEADHRRAVRLAQTLEAAVADATRQPTKLTAELSHLQEEVLHLQQKMTEEAEAWMAVLEQERVDTEKRRVAELSVLQNVVAAAQRSEHALQQRVARVSRDLEASGRRHLELLAEGRHQQSAGGGGTAGVSTGRSAAQLPRRSSGAAQASSGRRHSAAPMPGAGDWRWHRPSLPARQLLDQL